MRPVAAISVLAVLAASPTLAAEEMPVFRLEMRDGVMEPSRIEVPADKPFKLEITNTGKTPAEFESGPLKREKVLAAGGSSAIVFRRVETGEYEFFDDFHPEARGTLVAR
jgi:hypothetical protein